MSSGKLYHHGIKGQRWGVRRFQNEDGSLTSAGRSRYLNSDGSLNRKGKKEVKKWEKRINNGNNGWLKSYNRASHEFNRTIEEINKRYDGKDLGGDYFESKDGQRYIREVSRHWTKLYSNALISDFGRDPIYNGTDWVNNCPLMGMYYDYITDEEYDK